MATFTHAPTMPPTEAAQRREFEHPDASHAKKKFVSYPCPIFSAQQTPLADRLGLSRRPTPYAIEPIKAFYIFLVANLIAALFAPIQDCDETFNYWEPTHYLSHGYGLQTWEYSPDYAIRSWLYIGLHAIVGNIRRLLPHPSKVAIMVLRVEAEQQLTQLRSRNSTLYVTASRLAALCARRSFTRPLASL
jgi:alpha-1,2-mannosyltransferase